MKIHDYASKNTNNKVFLNITTRAKISDAHENWFISEKHR